MFSWANDAILVGPPFSCCLSPTLNHSKRYVSCNMYHQMLFYTSSRFSALNCLHKPSKYDRNTEVISQFKTGFSSGEQNLHNRKPYVDVVSMDNSGTVKVEAKKVILSQQRRHVFLLFHMCWFLEFYRTDFQLTSY